MNAGGDQLIACFFWWWTEEFQQQTTSDDHWSSHFDIFGIPFWLSISLFVFFPVFIAHRFYETPFQASRLSFL
jgi:hypothetical protein